MQTPPQTALEIGQAIERGDISPVELTEQALAHARASDAVFISLCEERVLREADAALRRAQAGCRASQLDGVPLAWKDLFDIAGSVTTAGSRVLSDQVATQDATAVYHASSAGLLTLGKTNLTELAYSGLGLNPHFGTPHNTPGSGPARVPGGSSSGSAVAVASGIVPAAIGTDTAGSLRVPAAFNGLVSYRPSQVRHDHTGVTPLARSLDTIGVFARSLADCVAVDDCMRGRRPFRQALGDPYRQASLVVDTNTLEEDSLAPAVRENLQEACAGLKEAGFNVIYRPVDTIRQTLLTIQELGWLGAVEAYTEYRWLLESAQAEKMDPRVRKRLENARNFPPDVVVTLYRRRRQLIKELEKELAGACLISPTVAHIAPELAPLEQDMERFAQVNLDTLRLAMVASLLDSPAIALPSGTDAQGQYTSLQISSAQGTDEQLIRTALTVSDILAQPAQPRDGTMP